MNKMRVKTLLGATALSLATVSVAYAGGFSRGSADTDILFEDGNFNMRSSVTYVSPSRKYATNPLNPYLVGLNHADDYVVPSFAVKFKIADSLSCAGTLTQSFGGSATWALSSGLIGKLNEDFTMYEYGATCGVKFDLEKGRIWALGGIYNELTHYALAAGSLFGTTIPRLRTYLRDSIIGCRAGLAYEIPDIRLRAQLMYRSGVDISATGTADHILLGSLPNGSTGQANFPQSVEFKLQSGIALGWLAYGSVKWTDWSVTKQLVLNVPDLARTSANDYYWRDGWTVTGGIGHAFSDKVSGTVFASWDRGVSTGWDLTAETYTLGVGASVKDDIGGELRFGAAVSRLGSVAETQYAPVLNRSMDSDWAFAFSGGYSLKW